MEDFSHPLCESLPLLDPVKTKFVVFDEVVLRTHRDHLTWSRLTKKRERSGLKLHDSGTSLSGQPCTGEESIIDCLKKLTVRDLLTCITLSTLTSLIDP